MTFKLCDHVIPIYNKNCSSKLGMITLTKLVLDEIFYMYCNVINELKNYPEIFRAKVNPYPRQGHLYY